MSASQGQTGRFGDGVTEDRPDSFEYSLPHLRRSTCVA